MICDGSVIRFHAPQCRRIGAFRWRDHSWGWGVSTVCHSPVLLRAAALAALGCALAAASASAEPANCRFTTLGTATVRGVTADGVLIDDGRVLRLDAIADTDMAQLNAALAEGTPITLKRLGNTPETDRYGRRVAHVFLATESGERWLQSDLIGRGVARVAARIGDPACAKLLQAAENSARTGKLGLWAEPVYVIGQADSPAEILKQRGRFALVEGKVLSVRESGGTIYVNFGRRWSEDFTVTVAKRNERAFVSAGLELRKLAGRQVRIRGWIEERGGPWVEASRPEQIEVVERN